MWKTGAVKCHRYPWKYAQNSIFHEYLFIFSRKCHDVSFVSNFNGLCAKDDWFHFNKDMVVTVPKMEQTGCHSPEQHHTVESSIWKGNCSLNMGLWEDCQDLIRMDI